ncbi:hypothetical protein AC1031_002791 [Aphanomyces cochlioides]|nr:hypothetical protein AC1031_002791 [Aphanomyces cochlioides]
MYGTMLCLRRKLVPLLTDARLTCDEIASIALDSHAACYTTENSNRISVCDLSLSDWVSLFRVIGFHTLVQSETIENGGETGLECLRDAFEMLNPLQSKSQQL